MPKESAAYHENGHSCKIWSIVILIEHWYVFGLLIFAGLLGISGFSKVVESKYFAPPFVVLHLASLGKSVDYGLNIKLMKMHKPDSYHLMGLSVSGIRC